MAQWRGPTATVVRPMSARSFVAVSDERRLVVEPIRLSNSASGSANSSDGVAIADPTVPKSAGAFKAIGPRKLAAAAPKH